MKAEKIKRPKAPENITLKERLKKKNYQSPLPWINRMLKK